MKALPSPFPLATRELRNYLEEQAEQHAFRAAELLNLYDKFLKRHHHPARHRKPAHYIKLAAKETIKAELCKMTLRALEDTVLHADVVAEEVQPFGEEEFKKAKAVLNGSSARVKA